MVDNGDDRLADTSTLGMFQTRDVYGLTMYTEATDKLHMGDHSDDKPMLGMFTEYPYVQCAIDSDTSSPVILAAQ